MSAPPFMKLYVADYLGDTHHLTALEHGAYLLLLMAMWRAGGTLPTSEANLSKMARCTEAEWTQVRETVLSFFQVSRGRLTHKRLAAELAKYEAVSRTRSEAGKLGGRPKLSENNGVDKAKAYQTQSISPHNQNQNQKDPPTPQQDIAGVVERVWGMQPKKRSSRPDVRSALEAAIKRGGDPTAIERACRAYYAQPDSQKEGGEFAKGAHRLIERDRWRDFLQDGSGSNDVGPAWDHDRWETAVRLWRQGGAWEPHWGPAPDEPGCRAPADLLPPNVVLLKVGGAA